MVATGTGVCATGFSPILRSNIFPAEVKPKLSVFASVTNRAVESVTFTEQEQDQRQRAPTVWDNGTFENKKSTEKKREDESQSGGLSVRDYLELSRELIARSDGGPPRWFSPLECGARLKDSPLLLYLPGIDGVGLGLTLHHERLGKIFDIWCLHIPVMDRTSFKDLVKMVESTVRSEHFCSQNRPIYLVGDSLGGCVALAVAARNPDIDLVLVLANPATSFGKSQLQTLIPLSVMLPEQFHAGLPYMLSLMTGLPSRLLMATMEKRLPLEQTVGELSKGAVAFSAYLSVLAELLNVETILWKLNVLKSAAASANSCLHAVKAQTLILTSGQDQLLPSREEGERLRKMLSKCEIRTFNDSGHALFLEDGFDLVTILMGASFYRRRRHRDYVFDYLPPSPSQFRKIYEPHRWTEVVMNPVTLSTLESGKVVRGLAGIPSEGPVLLVGYHMMLGLELVPLVSRFWIERNILVRGIAHPMMFTKLKDGLLPELSSYDTYRKMGAVPVSATNFYKLFSSNSHVLLYPGGMREALHRKGEEYKLFWPEQSEFVRMAARFGAKIIPFGVVGEDDVGQLLLDYDDLRKIPYFKAGIEELTDEAVKLRTDAEGEVSNQDVHLPIILPKLPGRFYFYFGRTIETKERKQELKSREKADELYSEVKNEVERCIDYLKDKRENDPYRNIFARLSYQAIHGFDSEVPTFDI
ncbi:acyltransferase At3g26840, chloroplastic isoform X1 [Olea europaea subsp. europaea]|uniref:Acyltransferase At3g26840, chloroplastic isoform X1 n=1 Tax=Olea europaea subsp. europaea TaxID=158383 RepID=A0A8S0RTJ1_OLEEU|nr:acyltransferase At3g26840, chloroplastic isoform X1 [Olea europaea subsp. europaea]